MLGPLLQWFGLKPTARRREQVQTPVRHVRGRYDAAQTVDENRRHWANADALSPSAANSPTVRATVRNRARYETENNCYARGMVDTLANHTVGTGPILQIRTEYPELNRIIEEEFNKDWIPAIGFGSKLTTARKSKCIDGESTSVLTHNPRLSSVVKVDWQLFECDRLASSPLVPLRGGDSLASDGIEYDQFGNPSWYHILNSHPGDTMRADLGTTPTSADWVIHWFRANRPGQLRGISELVAALPLFSQLRRYTLATLGAAETIADFAGVMKSPLSPDQEETFAIPSMEIEPRMLVTMPDGYEMQQLNPTHPTTTYGDFVERLVNEISRVLQMPLNIGLGNSSKYNFASGRLDIQVYLSAIKAERAECERVVLDRLFFAWLRQALLIPGYLPDVARTVRRWNRQWFWQKPPVVDPKADAIAESVRLANNSTTLADIWADQGADWREKIDQRAAEIRYAEERGISSQDPSGVSSMGRVLLQDQQDQTDAQDIGGRRAA